MAAARGLKEGRKQGSGGAWDAGGVGMPRWRPHEGYVAEGGGQPELLALARALDRPIVVYSRDSAPLRMGESDGEELVVTYHRDYYALGEHYNSTEPLRP